jgi:flagellar basal body-associated protein FliL
MNTAPNFDGEEMKIPATAIQKPATPEPGLINIPLLLILFVVLLLIFGGIYYWYTMSIPGQEFLSSRPTDAMNNEPESTTAEARTATADVLSTSNELDAIEADISSTQFIDLESALAGIENELTAALETVPVNQTQ